MSIYGNNFGKIVFVSAIYLLLLSNMTANSAPNNERADRNSIDKIDFKSTRERTNLSQSFYSKTDPIRPLVTQANNIEQLRDIQPTDWSYQAIRALSERYNCLQGYPDRTYRGDRVISRAEFVAGLNACLNQIEKAIADRQNVPQTDVDIMLRLMQEFQSDLAILQGKTDGLQARVGDLEKTQFSDTTKLQGEAIFGLGSLLKGDDASTILGSRLRIELNTSFSGNDLLFTRLSRNDFEGFTREVGTFQGNLAFSQGDRNEDFELDSLHYYFSLGDRLNLILGATGLEADDIAPTINVLDGDGGSGAISNFGTRNPIYYPPGDTGLGISHSPRDWIEISAGYLASTAEEPDSGSGLFNGAYSALGQIAVTPVKSLSLAATYVHSYNQSDTETGTNRANLRSLTAELFGSEVATVSNSYGLELSWTISDRFVLGGWGSLSKVNNLTTLDGQIDRGTQDIWNWAVTLAVPDLGKEGNLAGIVVGSEPQVTDSSIELPEDRDSLHLEAFYQYRINDNISITPGVIWITEPSGDVRDDDLAIGTVRTTFSF